MSITVRTRSGKKDRYAEGEDWNVAQDRVQIFGADNKILATYFPEAVEVITYTDKHVEDKT